MKLYDEIKDIITNQLGIKTSADYQAYLAAVSAREIKLDEVDLLSPENVHNGDFWRVITELFGLDCVANTQHGKLEEDIDAGNRRNFALARTMGALNFVEEFRHYAAPLLEIGPGYGNFKNYIHCTTALQYTGVDVHPKIPGVIPCLPNGLLPPSIREKKFLMIYSSNVFQHFSSLQRSKYFQDIGEMLMPGGIFVFNLLCVLSEPNKEKHKSEDGRAYLRQYGQFTEVPCLYHLRDELFKHVDVVHENRRVYDNLFNFTCTKKLPVLAAAVEESKKETLTAEQIPAIVST